jgi:hypothetical protein
MFRVKSEAKSIKRVSDYAESLGVDEDQFSLKNPKEAVEKAKPTKVSKNSFKPSGSPPTINKNDKKGIENKARKENIVTENERKKIQTKFEALLRKVIDWMRRFDEMNNEILVFDAILELLTNPKYKVLLTQEHAKLLSRILKRVGFPELGCEVDKEFSLVPNADRLKEEKKEEIVVANSEPASVVEPSAKPKSKRKKQNKPESNGAEKRNQHTPHNLVAFQIDHLIHKFQCNPIPDARVNNFNPDIWQKKLLDIVDKRSVFFFFFFFFLFFCFLWFFFFFFLFVAFFFFFFFFFWVFILFFFVLLF